LNESWKRAFQPSRAPTTKYTGSSSESGGSSSACSRPVRRCTASLRPTTSAMALESRPTSDSVPGPPACAGIVPA
jgi:hypothetical protein